MIEIKKLIYVTFLGGGTKKYIVESEKTILDVLKVLTVNPKRYSVSINSEIVTMRKHIRDGDFITLWPIVKGGKL